MLAWIRLITHRTDVCGDDRLSDFRLTDLIILALSFNILYIRSMCGCVEIDDDVESNFVDRER
jgi:hypothetical protein